MKSNKSFFLLIMGFSLTQILNGQFVTNHNALFQGEMTQPLPGVQFSDPNFHTPVTRLTDARTAGIHGLFPDYSKRQAWNSNESLMILRTGWGEAHLYNGQNYQFIKVLDGVGGEDVFWHPSNPDLIIYNPDSVLHSYNVITDMNSELHVFAPYTWANTRGEGNISNDGRYYAVVGQMYNYSTGEVIMHDLIVYDIQEGEVTGSMLLPQEELTGFDWVSISPLGNYVVVDYADEETGRYHGVEVYDRNFNFIWQKGLGAGHSDLGLDATGEEVLIMDVYDADANMTHLNKYVLATGTSTRLLSVSPYFDLHHSCRSMLRPGWVYISTFDYYGRLTDNSAGWLPFEDEIFALKMDGSESVERYAHHHSRRYSPSNPDSDNSVYYAEPHATVSRSGKRILFGSNWRTHIEEDFSIDTYLIDLTNLLTGSPQDELPQEEGSFKVYPNPVSDNLNILSEKVKTDYRIRLYNSIGMLLEEFIVNQNHANLDIKNLPAGLIYYQITDKTGIPQERGKIIKR
jgi:hypothetical protein